MRVVENALLRGCRQWLRRDFAWTQVNRRDTHSTASNSHALQFCGGCCTIGEERFSQLENWKVGPESGDERFSRGANERRVSTLVTSRRTLRQRARPSAHPFVSPTHYR
jgi:hypothetical protein